MAEKTISHATIVPTSERFDAIVIGGDAGPQARRLPGEGQTNP